MGGGGSSTFEAREGGLYDSANESLILQGRWIPAADGVPMVGDHQAVKDYAEALTTQAGDIRDYMDQVQQLEPDWESPEGGAADRFVALKGTLPPQMELVAERLETVAGALDTYADALKDAQDDAGGAAQAARDAETELEDANGDRSDAEDNLEQWEADHPDETFDWSGLDQAASDAETKLLDAWADFKQAYEDRWTAAETCTETIETAISDTGDTGVLNDAPREQASDDAEQLQSLLDELGVDVADFDPWLELRDLDPDDPEYMELYELLQEMGERYDEGAYSEVLFNELGADGIHAILGTIEMMQSHSQTGEQDPPLEVEDELLMPFLNGFASATDDMDSDILSDLTDVEDDWWKLPQLGLLLGGDGELYDPDFLADAADVVLVSEADEWSEVTWGYHPPSAEADGQLWDTMALNSPHLNAYNALADNPEASWLFAEKGDDNLNALLRPDTTQAVQTAGAQGVLIHDTVVAEVQQSAAGALTSGLFHYPLLNDSFDDQDTIDAVTSAIQLTGEGDLSGPARDAMAEITTPYSADLAVAGEASVTGGRLGEFDRLEDLAPSDVDAFFEEVTKSDTAVVVLTRNGAALAESMTYQAQEDGYEETAMRIAGIYQREMSEGLNENYSSDLQQAEATLAGRRAVTDAVVGVVANGLTTHPAVRGPAATPVGQAAVTELKGDTQDALADAVNWFLGDADTPDRQEIVDWYHTARDELNTGIAQGLFAHDGSRSELIAEAEANGEDTTGAADDLDRFMELGSVTNALDGLRGDAEDEFRDLTPDR